MIKVELKGEIIELETSNKLFSPKEIDLGTLDMLEQVNFSDSDKVLDLGCGYGVVGILAAKLIGAENVVMCDISKEAVKLANINAIRNNVSGIGIYESDALQNVPDSDFSLILSNPPYHEDFKIPKNFLEQGYQKLKINGKMIMVTKRREWYKNKFISVFGGVKIIESNNGYFIFIGEKLDLKRGKSIKANKDKNKLSKKLERKMKGNMR